MNILCIFWTLPKTTVYYKYYFASIVDPCNISPFSVLSQQPILMLLQYMDKVPHHYFPVVILSTGKHSRLRVATR